MKRRKKLIKQKNEYENRLKLIRRKLDILDYDNVLEKMYTACKNSLVETEQLLEPHTYTEESIALTDRIKYLGEDKKK